MFFEVFENELENETRVKNTRSRTPQNNLLQHAAKSERCPKMSFDSDIFIKTDLYRTLRKNSKIQLTKPFQSYSVRNYTCTL